MTRTFEKLERCSRNCLIDGSKNLLQTDQKVSANFTIKRLIALVQIWTIENFVELNSFFKCSKMVEKQKNCKIVNEIKDLLVQHFKM